MTIYRQGDVLRLAASDISRFWRKVDRHEEDACWEWLGGRFNSGYGRFKFCGKERVSHRVAYELTCGMVPDPLQLDHLCRNRGCANPAHLEPVTARENQRRGSSPISRNANATCCKRGHPLSGDNLHIRTTGRRMCWTCHRDRQKAIRAKPEQKAKHAARMQRLREENPAFKARQAAAQRAYYASPEKRANRAFYLRAYREAKKLTQQQGVEQ